MEKRRYLNYIYAILAVPLIILLRFALLPLIGPGIPYVTLFPVSVAVALLAGMGPAILTGVLGSIAIDYYFIEPLHAIEFDIHGISRDAVVILTSAFVGYVGDVLRAARAKAEKQAIELRENQERLRLAQQAANAGTWNWDITTNKLNWSPELYRLFGLDPTKGKVSFDVWRSVLHPEDIKEAEARIEQAIKNRTPLTNEYRVVLPNGEIRWINALGDTVYDEAGRPRIMSGICLDITERKQAEEALRGNEATLRGILDATKESIWLFNADGFVLTANETALSRFGKSAEEIIGKHLNEILSPELAQSRLAKLRETVEFARPVEFEDKRSNFFFHHSFYPVSDIDGQVTSVASFSRDITERKKAEKALRDSEQHLSVVFRASPTGIFVTRLSDGLFLQANEAYLQIIGYSSDEVVGHSSLELDIWINPQDRKEVVRMLRENGRIDNHEINFRRKNGQIINLLYSALPLERGGEQCILGTLTDITARKHAEKTLERTRNMMAEAQKISHLGSFEYDATNRTTVWSEEEYRIYGLDPAGPSPAYDVMLAKCIHPDDAALLHETFTKAMKSLSAYELEHRIMRPDGSVRWVYDRAHPYFDEKGSLLRYLGATLDITDRKKAEEMLRENKRDLDRAQLVGSIGSWRLDTRKNELTWSDENHRIFGIPKMTPMTYETFLSTIHPDDKEYVDKKWMAALKGENYDIEHRIIVDGQIKWVREKAFLEFDSKGKLLGGFGTTQDITERKKAEESLLVSEARYRRLFEAARDGILILDSESGKIVDVNPFIKDMLGYSHTEFLDKYLWEIGLFKDIVASKDAFLKLRNKGYVRYENLPLETKDGRHIAVEFVSNVYMVDRQKVIQCNIRDITDRAKAEEALRESYEELSRFNRSAVGREFRMIELKKEVNNYCELTGQPPRYTLDFEKENDNGKNEI